MNSNNEQQCDLIYIADIQDELLSLKFHEDNEIDLFNKKLLANPFIHTKWTCRSILVSIYTCYLCRPHSHDNYINLFINFAKHPNNSFQSDDYVNNFSNKFFIYQLYKANLVTIDSIYLKAHNFKDFLDYFIPEINFFYPTSPLIKEKSFYSMKQSVISSGYQIDENDIQSYLDKFIELRSKGQNPNPIAIAIRNDDVERFQTLLSQTNTSLNSTISRSIFERFIFIDDEEPTLIEFASYFGSINCFKFLYQNIQKLPESISDYAIAGGNYEIIHLIEQSQVKFTNTSLMTSIRFFQTEIMEYLEETLGIEKTIDDACKSIVYYNLRSLIECEKIIQVNPNKHESVGYTLLSIASMNGDLDIIKYLIQKFDKIDINLKTTSGLSPLMFAALKGHYEVIKYYSTLPKIDINATNNQKMTALHLACQIGNLKIVKFLCSLPKININPDCGLNLRPIDLAANKGYIEIIRYISSLPNVVIYNTGEKSISIIELAVQSKNIEVVKLVLDLVDKSLGRELKNKDEFKNNDQIFKGHMMASYNIALKNNSKDIADFLKGEIFSHNA